MVIASKIRFRCQTHDCDLKQIINLRSLPLRKIMITYPGLNEFWYEVDFDDFTCLKDEGVPYLNNTCNKVMEVG